MFGKTLSQYLAFQKLFLALIVAVGLLRLGLSLAGVPDSAVRWLPMNVVLWAGTFYYGVAVHRTRFGSYRQLLPLLFLQLIPFHGIAVIGILLAIAGFPNIFAAPEFSFGGQSPWLHLISHLTIGMVVPTLLTWGIASLVMKVTKSVARKPALA